MDSQNSQYILVDMLEDFLYKLVHKSIPLDHLFLCIDCLDHKAMGDKDFESQELEVISYIYKRFKRNLRVQNMHTFHRLTLN